MFMENMRDELRYEINGLNPQFLSVNLNLYLIKLLAITFSIALEGAKTTRTIPYQKIVIKIASEGLMYNMFPCMLAFGSLKKSATAKATEIKT